MSSSTNEVMAELLEKVSIRQIAETATTLKARGNGLWGISPFTSEKTPSFKVDEATNSFYCFSTKTGGGILELYALLNNVTRREALYVLAAEYGIEIKEENEDTELASLFKCLKAAQAIFQENRDVADEYLANPKRNLPIGTAEMYGVGYAPDSYSYLVEALRYQGFSDDIIIKSGLGTLHEDGRVTSFFYNRIMFPIKDTQGKIISFSGRRLLDVDSNGIEIKMPEKYRHGRVTRLFKKDKMVWGLDKARKLLKEKEYVIVMEGCLDVIPAQLAGEPAVGIFSAIPTKSQISIISKYTTDMYICSDSDRAGKEALLKTFNLVEDLDVDMVTYTVVLPEGKDPGEFLSTHEASEFTRLIRTAQPDTAYLVEITVEKFAASSSRKSALIRKVLEELSPYTKKLEKFSYKSEDLIERLSQAFGMDRKELRTWLSKEPKLAHNSRVYNKIEEMRFDAPAYERRILIEALRNPNITYSLQASSISLSDFENPLIAKTLGHIHRKPLSRLVFDYLEEKLSPEDYKQIFTVYHDANTTHVTGIDEIITTMALALERKRKYTPGHLRRGNILGKLNPAEKEDKPIIRDMIYGNEAKEE